MFGQIELENFTGLTTMPQKAASAFSALNDLVGASYKPLLYLGVQRLRYNLYWFIAEQTLITAPPERRIVKLAIVEDDDGFKLLPDSIEKLL